MKSPNSCFFSLHFRGKKSGYGNTIPGDHEKKTPCMVIPSIHESRNLKQARPTASMLTCHAASRRLLLPHRISFFIKISPSFSFVKSFFRNFPRIFPSRSNQEIKPKYRIPSVLPVPSPRKHKNNLVFYEKKCICYWIIPKRCAILMW